MLRPPSSFSMHPFREIVHRMARLAPLAASAACAAGDARDGEPRDTAAPAARGVPVVEAPAVSAAREDTLRLTLDVPREVARGAPVPFVFRVENVAGRPLELYLRGRTIAFDVVVTDAAGRPVWRRLEDEVIPAIVRLEELAPGAALTLRATWDQRTARGVPVGDGEYRAHAELLTETTPLASPPASFRLSPPR